MRGGVLLMWFSSNRIELQFVLRSLAATVDYFTWQLGPLARLTDYNITFRYRDQLPEIGLIKIDSFFQGNSECGYDVTTGVS